MESVVINQRQSRQGQSARPDDWPARFLQAISVGSAGLSRQMHRQVTDSWACTVGVCETDRGSGATLLLRREGGRGVVSFLSCLAYIT